MEDEFRKFKLANRTYVGELRLDLAVTWQSRKSATAGGRATRLEWGCNDAAESAVQALTGHRPGHWHRRNR